MKLTSFIIDVLLEVIFGWFKAIKGPIEDFFAQRLFIRVVEVSVTEKVPSKYG